MSSYTLIIGNKNYSSWSLRPWFWMKHAGLEFKEKRISLSTEETAQHLASYFSNYKVPVLQDNDLIIWDSLAILEYLAEVHPEKHGWPDDKRARATARSISAEMHSSFTALRSELPMNCRKRFDNFNISPAVQKDIDRIKAIWESCRDRYGREGSWLFGDFCIADAMFAPVVLRFIGYGVPLDDRQWEYVQTVVQNPQIKDWIDSGKREKEIIAIDEVNA